MAAISVPAQRARRGKLRRREAIAGMLFVLPWVINLLVFIGYPVLASVYFSFTEYSIVQAPRWIGLQNYQTMFTADPAFWTSVKNSLYYALVSVPLGLITSLGLALLLNLPARGISVYRTLLYLPVLAPPVVGTMVFLVMFNPRGGLINATLGTFGVPPIGWTTDPDWAKPALIILSLWGVGASVLIFLAGLKEIPQSLLEAAAIDGANVWQRFMNVTLPLLSPVILFNLVMGIISSFQVFTQAIVIGGTTGRPVESTLMYMVHIYRTAFKYLNMGYASALSVVLFGAILLITLVVFRSARLWVFYEGDNRAA